MTRFPKIRALVVDDEPHAREGLRKLLEADPDIQVCGVAANGEEAISEILAKRPELCFLDVQMPTIDGFEVLETIGPGEMPHVIFVTAYDRYALRAFAVHALDYLVKPFDDDRFRDALAHAKQAILRVQLPVEQYLGEMLRSRERISDSIDARPPLKRIAVREHDKLVLIRTADIDFIEAQDYYSCLHVGKNTYLVRRTMADLERLLDPEQFARIHRSSIVNLDRIRELQSLFNGEYLVVLRDGTEHRLSRTRAARLRALLKQVG